MDREIDGSVSFEEAGQFVKMNTRDLTTAFILETFDWINGETLPKNKSVGKSI